MLNMFVMVANSSLQFFVSSVGLFDRAIAMSGLATAPYNNPTKKPIALARKQAELVGIENAQDLSSAELVTRLREVDVTTLIDSGDGLRVCWQSNQIVSNLFEAK